VDATVEGVQVPIRFVKDGRIVLSIDTNAVADLYLGDDQIRFKTRFHGQSMEVLLPVSSVMAIYPREKPDQSLVLQDGTTRNTQEDRFDHKQAHGTGKNPGRPNLKLVE
jgi:stringent starvation protein B